MANTILRGERLTVEIEMVSETCCNCGMVFAMTKEFKDAKLNGRGEKERSFYCPAGHGQHYTGESEADKLRRERDRLKQNAAFMEDQLRSARERAERERNRANGYKGFATRITKRAKAGICPCCNRHFQQLERHMANKHPQFTPIEIHEGEPA